MKIWGTGAFIGVLAAGCAAPAGRVPTAYEEPSDAKAMVDRLRVERPSYRPTQIGAEPLSVYIEASPTYYPPVWCDYRWGYRSVKWADCGDRPYGWKGYGHRYGSPAPYSRLDCGRRW